MPNNPTPTIQVRDPNPLKLHPLLSRIPVEPADSPTWASFVDGISGAGPNGIPPIFVTPEGWIIDGARRWRAAKQLQWPAINCLEQPEWNAGTCIIETLMGQRSMTRGAKVYLWIPIVKEFIDSAETRRLSNLHAGRKTLEKPLKSPNSSTLEFGGIKGLCERWGISEQTFHQAKQVHKLFYDERCTELARLYKDASMAIPALPLLKQQQQAFREEFEPQLLAGEKNLWNILSAAGGRIASEDQPRVDHQLEFLFRGSLDSLVTRAARFTNVSEVKPIVRAWIENVSDKDKLVRLAMVSQLIQDEIERELEGYKQPAAA